MNRKGLITRGFTPPDEFVDRFVRDLLDTAADDLELAIAWFSQATLKLSLDDCSDDLQLFAGNQGKQIAEPRTILEALFAIQELRFSTGPLESLLNLSKKKP